METHMSMLTVAQFNEPHQRAFGCAPAFGVPERHGPDHRPVVSVMLEIDDCSSTIIGIGSNQRLARQDAVDKAIARMNELPYALRQAIESKLGF